MKTVIHEARLINGDGLSDAENMTIVVDGERIVAVYEGEPSGSDLDGAADVLAVGGSIVFPGLINTHAHRVTLGPSSAYGAPAKPAEEVVANVARHLSQGTTTILSVDGFATADEVAATQAMVDARIGTTTIAYPTSFVAADLSDGKGLRDLHRAYTAEQAVAAGAVAVGECGAGGTLGGGSQDWLFIPTVVEKLTGRVIEPRQARGLKYAVLGRDISRDNYDEAALVAAIEAAGLTEVLSVPEVKKLVEDSVLPQFETALQTLLDGAEVASRLGVPVILHNAKASKHVVDEASRRHAVVAGHSNHSSFESDGEAVDFARVVKSRGSFVDVCTLDCFVGHRTNDSPDRIYALFEAGVVDTISTDYAGGKHDAISLAIELSVEAGVITLAQGVRMASLNPARIFPGLAPKRGLIAPDWVADLVISKPGHLGSVTDVMVGGRFVHRTEPVVASA